MFKMMWACGLVLVLLFPQFPSIREIDFSGTIDIEIENELLPRNPDKHCGEEDAVNLHNLNLRSIPNHMIKSDKIRHVDLSFNGFSEIPNSFFLDVPNLECLNLTSNTYPPKDILDGSKSYSLKTLVLDDTRNNPNSGYRRYDNYESDNRCKMTGYFPNLEILHLSNIEKCSINAFMEDTFPRLAKLYLTGYGSTIELNKWQLPTTLRHLHLEGTKFDNISFTGVSNLQSLYLDNYPYISDFYIPSEIANLQVLSCRKCSLVKMDVERFFDSPRSALRLLDLSDNFLYGLPDNMFQQTSNLESLILSNNMLSLMPDLQALSQLRGLVLNYNIINLVADRNSDSLKMLSLRGNGISQINAAAFEGFPALEMLDLSENDLTFLPIGWAESLVNLVTLNLKKNLFMRLSDISLTLANGELRHLLMSVHPIKRFNEEDFELLPDNCTIYFMLSPPG